MPIKDANRRNDPQKVLKSIPLQEEIVLCITKRTTGGELGNVLQGVEAFTKCFSAEDQYEIEIKVEKVINQELQNT